MICITFDTDWMETKWMESFLSRFEIPGDGTFFLWKPMTELNWRSHELAPHPFLNHDRPWIEQVLEYRAMIDGQVWGVRPHSCAYDQVLGTELSSNGFKYISATTPLFQRNLKPYRHPWGIWELPIYYMDNMDFCFNSNWPKLPHTPFDNKLIEIAVRSPDSLFVFDFHPLHIALNTPSREFYSSVRSKVVLEKVDPFMLTSIDRRGTRDFFEELINEMFRSGTRSLRCIDAIEKYANTALY